MRLTFCDPISDRKSIKEVSFRSDDEELDDLRSSAPRRHARMVLWTAIWVFLTASIAFANAIASSGPSNPRRFLHNDLDGLLDVSNGSHSLNVSSCPGELHLHHV